MFNSFKFIATLSLFVFFLQSCKKEQPQITNPLAGCNCAHEVSADFAIEEMTGPEGFDPYYTDTDTSYTDKNIRFRAFEKDADYTWYIGTEVLSDSSLIRYFPNSLVENQTISISLVVKKKPNTVCFPNDDGYDSITKTVHFVKFPETTGSLQSYLFNFVGTYRVKMPHLADSQDVIIDSRMDVNDVSRNLTFVNYDGMGNSVLAPTNNAVGLALGPINYQQFWISPQTNSTSLDNLQGNVRKQLGSNIYEFNLSYGASQPNLPGYISRKYLGRKIN